MRLSTSYRQILKLAGPIMVGGAAQNAVTFTDSAFLYHRSELDFAAIGFVSMFYLIVAAIGFGFSRAGQLLVARRTAQRDVVGVRHTFQSMLAFELLLAVGAFAFMQLGSYYLFAALVDSDAIFYKSLDYLAPRSYGVFAGYAAMAFVALYSGLGRTQNLIFPTVVLLVCNIALNYSLIFGRFGLPEMGIAGAGLASTISEYVALACFLGYVVFDRVVREIRLLRFDPIEWASVLLQLRLGLPVVAQSVVGLGSYLFFFGIVENLGARALAITNLVRIVYFALSIPAWGFATAINTLTSHFLGRGRRRAIVPLTQRVAFVCALSCLALAVPVALFPKTLLYPVFGSENSDLISAAQPVFLIVLAILVVFSYGATFFNSLVGTGGVYYALRIQTYAAVIYAALVYAVVQTGAGGLRAAWATELVYWGLVWWWSYRGLSEKRWQGAEV